jgi:hypothetical protein
VMIPSSPDDHPPPDYPRHCYYCCWMFEARGQLCNTRLLF